MRKKHPTSNSGILSLQTVEFGTGIRRISMVTVGLLARLEAKPGKEMELESFLRGALPLAEQELATVAWFAIRLGPATFGIFDVFPDESGRQAHLNGPIAAALMQKASELLSEPPEIKTIEVLAAKLKE
jgi:quinol monooxygenase YgiN